jgi:hypothetical protein
MERREAEPVHVRELIAQLMARRGYAQTLSVEVVRHAWSQAVGPLATQCIPGNIRRGVLEITVVNSTVMQELSFRKRQLVKELQRELPKLKIHDLRFRVGVID